MSLRCEFSPRRGMQQNFHTVAVDAVAEPLIKMKAPRVCRMCGLPPTEVETIEQDLRVHLWLIRDSVDSAQEPTKREAFIDTVLNNRGITLIRRHRAQMRDPNREAYSLDDDCCDATEPSAASEKLDLIMDVRQLLEDLSPALRAYTVARLEERLAEFVRRRGLSRRQVDRYNAELKQACVDRNLDRYI